jgi:hypothetical protein
MHGSTFRPSGTDRARRRATGPALTLVDGTGARSSAPSSVVPRSHPGFEGFTPDEPPAGHAGLIVHRSGPESMSDRRSSRGNTSPGVGGSVHSGPGPHVPQADLVRRIAEQLADFDARRPTPLRNSPPGPTIGPTINE